MLFVKNVSNLFQVTEALSLVIKLAEYLAKLPKVSVDLTIRQTVHNKLHGIEQFSWFLLDKTWYDTDAKVKYQAVPCIQFDNLHSTNSENAISLSTCFFLQMSLTNTMDQLPEKVPDLLVRQGIVILDNWNG